jgi:hypothetical protein
MKPTDLYTAKPHAAWDESDDRPKAIPPQASDNDAERKVLIYGPKGEALIEQRPRPIGFRVKR